MSKQTQDALAVEVATVPTAALVDLSGAGGASYWTSLPRETDDEKGRALNALQAMHPKLATVVNKEIAVRDVLAHVVTLADDDGVAREQVRTVLVGPDGQSFQAVSDGVAKSLRMLADTFGSPPWVPALVVRVVQVEAGRGRYYYLEYVKRAKAK